MIENYRDIFVASYQRISEVRKDHFDFYDSFYCRFTASSPEVEAKFKDVDMAAQKKFLRDSLAQMIYFGRKREADDYMLNLAKIHSRSGKNIQPYLYDLWLECLVDTVKDFDPKYNQDVGIAWRVLMAPGITFMKFKYDK